MTTTKNIQYIILHMHHLASVLQQHSTEQVDLPLHALQAGSTECSDESLNKLRTDIDENGMRRPLIALAEPGEKNTILAGHKRHLALSTSEDGQPRPHYTVPVTLITPTQPFPYLLRHRIRFLDDLADPEVGPYPETRALFTIFILELGRYNEMILSSEYAPDVASSLLKAFASTNHQRHNDAATHFGFRLESVEAAIQTLLELARMKLPSFVSNRLPLLFLKHRDLTLALMDNAFPANAAAAVDKVTDKQQRAHLIALGAAGKAYRELNALAKAIQETHGRVSPDAKLLRHANQVRELLQDVPPLHYNDHTRLDEALQTISTILTKR